MTPKMNSECNEQSEKFGAKVSCPLKRKLNSTVTNTEISFSNLELDDTNQEKPTTNTNKLLLTGEIFFNKELIIEHNGLRNGLRKKNDSKVFFGISDIKDYTGTNYNDFLLNVSSKGSYSSFADHTGRVFEISYSKKNNHYQISMINNSMCLYYQIEHKFYFELERDYLFLLGKTFIEFYQKEEDHVKYLEVKIEYGEESQENEMYTFSENQVPITIGREGCNITINKKSISKTHAIINFSKNLKTFSYTDNQSTNGSILIMKEEDSLKIKGDMKFKLNDIMFHILELP